MLHKKTKMKKSNLLILLTWLKGETTLTNKPFPFDYLFSECIQDNGDIDVQNIIDQLMIDLFGIYNKLKSKSKEELEEKLKQNVMFNVLSKDIVSESMRSLNSFLKLYEDILMNTKFEYPEIRGIQKNIMT